MTREDLRGVKTICPNCGEDFQVQLKEWLSRVVWKCRVCTYEWEDNKMETGIELIAAERQRQIEDEGWTPEHDDDHTDGSLAVAATCYAAPIPIYGFAAGKSAQTFYDPWPWGYVVRGRSMDDQDGYRLNTTEQMKEGKDRLRQLAIAGALIAAEIDRIQRADHPAAEDKEL